MVSSEEIGLALGVVALALPKIAMGRLSPPYTGGGAARLIPAGKINWARGTERFEAGTPAIVNVIAFAAALSLTADSKKTRFDDTDAPFGISDKAPMFVAARSRMYVKDIRLTKSGTVLVAQSRKGLPFAIVIYDCAGRKVAQHNASGGIAMLDCSLLSQSLHIVRILEEGRPVNRQMRIINR